METENVSVCQRDRFLYSLKSPFRKILIVQLVMHILRIRNARIYVNSRLYVNSLCAVFI